MVTSSIKGTDEIVERVNRIEGRLLTRIIHSKMIAQMRSKRSEIPRATGALERSILDGSDDLISDHRVTIEAVAYARYQKLPQIDTRKLAADSATELFRRAGMSGGF